MSDIDQGEFVSALHAEACQWRQKAEQAEQERDALQARVAELEKERDELRRRVAVLEALVHAAQCPQCDGSGAYYDGIGNVCQCQWCYETEKSRETAASKIKAETVLEFAEQTGDHYVINMAIDYNKANQIEGGA